MSWKDFVFTGGQFIFVLALLPTIIGKDKPAFVTSLLTSLILVTFGVAYLTLNLLGSAVMAFANSTCWAILAIQKYLKDRVK